MPARNDASRFVERDVDSVKDQADVLIIRLAGNLYFGSASDLEAKLNALTGKAKVYVLLMRRIITIDVTSLGAITNFVSDVKAAGGDVILCGVGSGLNKALMCSNLLSDVGCNRQRVYFGGGISIPTLQKYWKERMQFCNRINQPVNYIEYEIILS